MNLESRVAELEAKVRYLEQLLGLEVEAGSIARLRTHGLPYQAARLAIGMSARPAHVWSWGALSDMAPAVNERDDHNTIKQFISKIRHLLGKQSVETIPWIGYRLTNEGAHKLQELLA